MLKSYLSLFLLLLSAMTSAFADGKFINPVTDVCWKCVFPIHAGGVNVTPSYKDYVSYSKPICACPGTPPKVGIPLAFWEPMALIEVVRTPYKCLALGGASLGSASFKYRGGVSHIGDSNRHGFYNVHYYKFPVLSFLDLFPGFSCVEKRTDMDIVYMSELDPFWSDEAWNAATNPDTFLYANPGAQAACIGDCTVSSIDKPKDTLHWCAGCSGSLYPFTGHVAHHIGGIQASHLIAQRLLAKLHKASILWGLKDDDFCDRHKDFLFPKRIYKTQLAYPIANSKGPCQPLGKTEIVWGAGKSYPKGGEDFIYLVWTKKQCCLDAVKITLSSMGVAQ